MFEDVSARILVNPPRRNAGVAVLDLDGDERFEVVVAGLGPNRVLKWAAGALRDMAPPEIADTGAPALSLAGGDIDGDGREELYVVVEPGSSSTGPADRLFKSHPDGRWEDLFTRPANYSLRNRSAGRSVAAVDRRGVGRYGFFVACGGGLPRFYEQAPDGALTDLASPLGLSLAGTSRGVLVLPLFDDHPDIICLNDLAPNFAFRNRGDGTFEECASRVGLADCGESGCAIAAVDVRGNGRLDPCWGNGEGPHRFLARTTEGAWKDCATPGFAFPSAVGTVIAADFDNDGRDEVFFVNAGEPNRLFRIEDGAPTKLDPGEALDPEGSGTGAAVCDLDGDGILELLLSCGSGEPQPLRLYKARTRANNWLRVRPLTRFGAPARGAVVRVESQGRTMAKGICGGSGQGCQMEPVAHFGLGPKGRAERIEVTWPDGTILVFPGPQVNRTLTIGFPRG